MRIRVMIATAAIFAMVLATPAAATTPPSGEATTDLLGLELEVDGVDVAGLIQVEDLLLSALEVGTSAAVDDGTLALIDVLPLAVNGDEHGRSSLRSENGDDETDTTSATVADLIDVGVLDLRAETTSDTARAVVSTADDWVAGLPLLGDAGISLAALASLSEVDAESATGEVGLSVSGIDLGLDDLLGDALAELPLDVLLDLARALLGADLGDIGDLDAALGTVQGIIGDLAGEIGDLDDALDDLSGSLSTVQSLESLVSDLASDLNEADAIGDAADALLPVPSLGAVENLVDDINALVADYPDAGVSPVSLQELNLVGTVNAILSAADDLYDHIDGLLQAAESDLAGALSVLEGDASAVEGLLDGVEGLLNSLVGALEGLLDAILDLVDGVLDDLLGDLEDANILGIGDISVGMLANADAQSATATMECAIGGTSVDCIQTASDVAGIVTGSLDTLNEVLGILGGGIGVDGITLEIFGVSDSTTDTDGETNTAEATLEILRLEIPSVDLGGLVGDALDGLLGDLLDGDLDVIGDLDALLDGTVSSLLGTVDGLVGGVDLTGALGDVETGIDEVDDLVDDIADALGDLEEAILGGDLTGVSTPGVKLLVDPTVTASYTPGDAPVDAGPVPGDDPTTPSPDDDDPAALPTTGGGMALLSLLLIAGAVMLRRRLAPLP